MNPTPHAKRSFNPSGPSFSAVRVLLGGLGLTLASEASAHAMHPLPHRGAWFAPTTEDAYAKTLEEAEQAVRDRRILVALDLYHRAYELLPIAERSGTLGSDLIELASIDAQDAYERGTRDVEMLVRMIALLDAHLRNVGVFRPESDTSIHESSKARFETYLSDLQSGKAEVSTSPTSVALDTSAAATTATIATAMTTGTIRATVESPDPPSRPKISDPVRSMRGPSRAASIGLVAGGGLGLAAGASLLGYGVWYRGQVDAEYARGRPQCESLDPVNYESCVRSAEDYLETGRSTTNGLIAGGAAVATFGAAAFGTGIYFLVRRKQPQRFAMVPTIGATFGWQARGTF